MDRASWALGQGLVHRVFLLPWGHLGSRASKGEGGLGREKEGRRQKLGRLLLKLFEWIRRELYADHHRN